MRKLWLIYACGFFLFLAGVLSGIYAANSFADIDKIKILFSIMGYAAASKTGMRFLRLVLYRFMSLCGIILFSNSIIMLPFTIFGFCISGAMWGVGMGCIFLSVAKLKFVLLIPFFIVVLFLHAIPHIHVFYKMLTHIRHIVKDRRIPKSSSDLLKEFLFRYQSCLGWFLFSAAACVLEAFLLPLFLA